MFRDYIQISINGKIHKFRGEHAFRPLSDLLRYEMGLTGTKVVCAEGDCGACTVMYSRPGTSEHLGQFRSLNTCISSGILMDSCHIITVEALEKDGQLSPVQKSMMENFGGQCGFCTPGFVVSITNMFEHKMDVTEKNVKNYLTGNLCRCTGYSPIIQAALNVDPQDILPLKEYFNFKKLTTELEEAQRVPIKMNWGEKEFYAPANIEDAVLYLSSNQYVRIFSGATDLGVQMNKGKDPGRHLLSLHLLSDLYKIKRDGSRLQIGARVNLDQLQIYLESEFSKFSDFLNIFASPQIKNTATLVGNLANASPIADTIPFLLAVDAVAVLQGKGGVRKVPVTQFIVDYKKLDLSQDELITHIEMELPQQEDLKVGFYKISQRRDLDISCVNSSFIFQIEDNKIKKARIAYGGVGPKSIRLTKAERALEGKVLSSENFKLAKDIIKNEISPISDVRGSSNYRRSLALDLFDQFLQESFQI